MGAMGKDTSTNESNRQDVECLLPPEALAVAGRSHERTGSMPATAIGRFSWLSLFVNLFVRRPHLETVRKAPLVDHPGTGVEAPVGLDIRLV